jgi:hypothetical protein
MVCVLNLRVVTTMSRKGYDKRPSFRLFTLFNIFRAQYNDAGRIFEGVINSNSYCLVVTDTFMGDCKLEFHFYLRNHCVGLGIY